MYNYLVLTHGPTGQRPTQKSYEKRLLFQKECCRPYYFCREADQVGSGLLCMYNLLY